MRNIRHLCIEKLSYQLWNMWSNVCKCWLMSAFRRLYLYLHFVGLYLYLLIFLQCAILTCCLNICINCVHVFGWVWSALGCCWEIIRVLGLKDNVIKLHVHFVFIFMCIFIFYFKIDKTSERLLSKCLCVSIYLIGNTAPLSHNRVIPISYHMWNWQITPSLPHYNMFHTITPAFCLFVLNKITIGSFKLLAWIWQLLRAILMSASLPKNEQADLNSPMQDLTVPTR